MLAFVQVATEPEREPKILETLKKLPEVKEAHIVFGEWDIIVKVESETPEQLGSFIVANIRSLEGVNDTKTLIIARS